MLQPEIRYSKSFNTIKSGSFTTENYLTKPHSSKGTFKTSGDYWGVSLSVYIINLTSSNRNFIKLHI